MIAIETASAFYALNINTSKIAKLNRQLDGTSVTVSPIVKQYGGVWNLYGYECSGLLGFTRCMDTTLSGLMDKVNDLVDSGEIKYIPYF